MYSSRVPYKYQTLDLDGPSIRLLQLLEGSFTDEIRCEVFEGWIGRPDHHMPYEALSYTWGSSGKISQILVNDQVMLVTPNLYSALQHIRSEDQDRVLWVDAICINQESNDERQHQVQQMSRIYEGAEEVLVWLGNGTEETDFLMDFIKQLHLFTRETLGDWRHLARCRIRIRPDGYSLEDKKVENQRLCIGMVDILGRPWFRRVWILQEIANARVARIYCGRKSVSARVFAQFPSLLGVQTDSHCQAVLDVMPGYSRKESWWGRKRDLYTLLSKFRNSEATDERDIIYALLGISSDACQSNTLVPDYSRSLEEVIQDTTSFLLFQTKKDSLFYTSHGLVLPVTMSSFLHTNLSSLGDKTLENAVRRGDEEVVRYMLTSASVEVAPWRYTNKSFYAAMREAAVKGHENILKLVLEKAMMVSEGDLLKMDFIYRRYPTTRYLASRDGDPHQIRPSTTYVPPPRTASRHIWVSTTYGPSPQRRPHHIQASTTNGPSPYTRPHHIQASTTNGTSPSTGPRQIHALTKYGPSPGSRTEEAQVLSQAASIGGLCALRKLLKAESRLEQLDVYEFSLLQMASWFGHENSISLLAELITELKPENNIGPSPLSLAACKGHRDFVQQMLAEGADLKFRDPHGFTPLHSASRFGYERIVSLLLEQGADLEAKDNCGRSPLSLAAGNGEKAAMQLLVAKGADRESKDELGRSPLWWAREN